MKQVFSNGLMLEVRDIGEPVYKLKLRFKSCPLPIILKQIVSDEEARAMVKAIDKSKYWNVPCDKSEATSVHGQNERTN